MLDIILRILPIVGIIFLIVLLTAVALVFLVLFFPVTYRISVSREADLKAMVKARWLFGLLRVRYQYPDPGHIIAKVLCFTLYDSKFPAPKQEDTEEESGKENGQKPSGKKQKDRGTKKGGNETGNEAGGDTAQAAQKDSGSTADGGTEQGNGGTEDGTAQVNPQEGTDGAEKALPGPEGGDDAGTGKFFQKITKIKYTIRSFCDKIKEIWENISYYIELLHEESTKELFATAFFRVGKILKCIRPRQMKADILFGTGSPDTTGYVYGLYCMLASPGWDKVQVMPDFENAVFKGNVEISGHVILWVLLINGLKLVLDKRLKKFSGKLRAERKGSNNGLKKDSKKDSM